jgi:hypothetical protein
MPGLVRVTFERLVVLVHRKLKSTENPLGFCGAEAIAQELADRGVRPMHKGSIESGLVIKHFVVHGGPACFVIRKASFFSCPDHSTFIVEH